MRRHQAGRLRTCRTGRVERSFRTSSSENTLLSVCDCWSHTEAYPNTSTAKRPRPRGEPQARAVTPGQRQITVSRKSWLAAWRATFGRCPARASGACHCEGQHHRRGLPQHAGRDQCPAGVGDVVDQQQRTVDGRQLRCLHDPSSAATRYARSSPPSRDGDPPGGATYRDPGPAQFGEPTRENDATNCGRRSGQRHDHRRPCLPPPGRQHIYRRAHHVFGHVTVGLVEDHAQTRTPTQIRQPADDPARCRTVGEIRPLQRDSEVLQSRRPLFARRDLLGRISRARVSSAAASSTLASYRAGTPSGSRPLRRRSGASPAARGPPSRTLA